MANRSVFTLAAIVMLLFFLASHVDNYFFLLHFLEAVIYAVILLLLFYGLEDWAYVLGFLTPLVWMVLTILSGTLLAGLRALGALVAMGPVDDVLGLVTGLIFLAALALLVVSARAYKREVWGRPGALRVFVGAAVAVMVYYAAVLFTLYRMVLPTR